MKLFAISVLISMTLSLAFGQGAQTHESDSRLLGEPATKGQGRPPAIDLAQEIRNTTIRSFTGDKAGLYPTRKIKSDMSEHWPEKLPLDPAIPGLLLEAVVRLNDEMRKNPKRGICTDFYIFQRDALMIVKRFGPELLKTKPKALEILSKELAALQSDVALMDEHGCDETNLAGYGVELESIFPTIAPNSPEAARILLDRGMELKRVNPSLRNALGEFAPGALSAFDSVIGDALKPTVSAQRRAKAVDLAGRGVNSIGERISKNGTPAERAQLEEAVQTIKARALPFVALIRPDEEILAGLELLAHTRNIGKTELALRAPLIEIVKGSKANLDDKPKLLNASRAVKILASKELGTKDVYPEIKMFQDKVNASLSALRKRIDGGESSDEMADQSVWLDFVLNDIRRDIINFENRLRTAN